MRRALAGARLSRRCLPVSALDIIIVRRLSDGNDPVFAAAAGLCRLARYRGDAPGWPPQSLVRLPDRGCEAVILNGSGN